jgi:excisionase family DNA binding protein
MEKDDEYTIRLWPDAARIIGCGKSKIYELAKSGEIPTIRIGRLRRALRKPLLRQVGAE